MATTSRDRSRAISEVSRMDEHDPRDLVGSVPRGRFKSVTTDTNESSRPQNPSGLLAGVNKLDENNRSMARIYARLKRLKLNLDSTLIGAGMQEDKVHGEPPASPHTLHRHIDEATQILAAMEMLVSEIEELM